VPREIAIEHLLRNVDVGPLALPQLDELDRRELRQQDVPRDLLLSDVLVQIGRLRPQERERLRVVLLERAEERRRRDRRGRSAWRAHSRNAW
jgi:hypothetical protein